MKLEHMTYNLRPRWHDEKVPFRKPLVMIRRVVAIDRRRTLFLQQHQHGIDVLPIPALGSVSTFAHSREAR